VYVEPNFPTKKALREAVKRGDIVRVVSPGPFAALTHGETSVEGPHYPKPHTWYARVQVDGGRVVRVIS
jgi:hypothetical protein